MPNSYLTRTEASPTSTKKGTFSAWIKGDLTDQPSSKGLFSGHVDNNNRVAAYFGGNSTFRIYGQASGSQTLYMITDRAFRDPSAWYHFVIAWDTSQGTASNRLKIYVNGEQITSFSTESYPAQDIAMLWNTGTTIDVGARRTGSVQDYWDGYISHAAFVDGTQLTPTSFGETNTASGIWKFKNPTGITWGHNGFHLKFENSGALGTDSSGNSNTYTVQGDLKQALDTPSNSYSTFNPLHFGDTISTGYGTFSNGHNRYASTQAGSPYPYTLSTLAASSGKWYAEFKITQVGGSSMVGISDGQRYPYLGDSGNKDACLFGDGKFYPGNSNFGSAFSDNDICGVAMDLDNMKVYFSKNGTWQNSGDPTSGSTGTGAANIPTGGTGFFHFGFGDSSGNTTSCSANFGNGFFGTTAITSAGSNGNGSLFEYDVPSGYYALNTKNLNSYG